MKTLMIILIIMNSAFADEKKQFVLLNEYCPQVIIEASYSGKNNFTGSVVNGYKSKKLYLVKPAADALCKVQLDVLSKGLTLKVFDAYRPVRAVKFFQDWAKKNEDNLEIKKRFYPKFSRQELFKNGYIANESSHSRGAAIDLTLSDLKTGKELDMGGEFDYFDEISWTDYALLTDQQKNNRKLLKDSMEKHHFRNYHQEWWHFSLNNEPYPSKYFDFIFD